MDDLTTWLRAQLDDDERIATTAGGADPADWFTADGWLVDPEGAKLDSKEAKFVARVARGMALPPRSAAGPAVRGPAGLPRGVATVSAIGLPGPCIDDHFDPSGLCQCPCEECTTRTARFCVCQECRCEGEPGAHAAWVWRDPPPADTP